MKKVLLGVAAIAMALSTVPAFADYYIVREGSSGPCRIVEQRPTDTKTVIVGGDKVFTTHEEAQKQMTVLCHSQ